jgi:hypothetical protein
MGSGKYRIKFPCGFEFECELSSWNIVVHGKAFEDLIKGTIEKAICPLHGDKCKGE